MRKAVFLLAGLAWTGAAAAQDVPATLADLKREQGTVEVHYERATARAAAFAPLLAARETAAVRVLVVNAEDSAAWRIGAAYAQGAGKVLGNVATVHGRAAVPPEAYVVEVSYSLSDHEMAAAGQRVLEFRDGEKCTAQVGGGVKCQDMVDNVVDKGKRMRMIKATKVEVTIKLRAPSGDAVAEDVYSVVYPGSECSNPVAASSTIARVIGAQAVVRRPISSQFYSDLDVLACQQR